MNSTGSQDSDARVKQEERLTVLCIDWGCFHALTHPRDHWEKKEKEKKKKGKEQAMNGRPEMWIKKAEKFPVSISDDFMHYVTEAEHTAKIWNLSHL